MEGASTNPPAGWYEEPDGDGLRYWNGEVWTGERKDSAVDVPAVAAQETAVPSVSRPSAGWYPDPELPATFRYWDGSGWTDARQAAAASTSAKPAAFWVGLGGVAGIAIGSIGPWATAGFLSVGGLHGDGKLTLGLAIVAGLVLLLSDAPAGGLIGCSVLAAAVSIYHIADISNQSGFVGAVASPGWGLILAAVASGVVFVAGIVLAQARRAAPPS